MSDTKHTREPIISVLGHVDSGKTTLLDHIRGTVVASREAGGITQHIGATDIPFEVIREVCGELLSKIKLKISVRGLLFIDTPGHEAFTTLRKRGGSVADLAVLVVDAKEGLMPQTIESINILRQYKTPFVVAFNKVDSIGGWVSGQPLEKQQQHVRDEFDKRYYTLIGQLSEHGFESELYTRVTNFSQQVAIVPTSAKTGYGVPHLLMVVMGLTQQYLENRLSIEITTPGKGTVLEVKEDKGLGTTVDAIIYDGIIRRGDSIVLGGRSGPFMTRVKALLRPRALDEMRDPREKFKNISQVYAASGVKIVAPGLDAAIPGTPVYVGGEELLDEIQKEIDDVEIISDKLGVVVKADTLGSLEAIVHILEENNIPVKRGTIGKVSKQDVIEASAVSIQNKFLGVVLAFNSQVLDDARDFASDEGVHIIENRVVYKIIEDYIEWAAKEREKDKLARRSESTSPARFRIMPDHTFRQSKPAIVGVEVLAGTLSVGARIQRMDGKVVGRIKEMQAEKESIKQANAGEQIAVSIENVMIGRQLSEGDVVYSFISTQDEVVLRGGELSDEEKQILAELREIRRRAKGG